MTLNVTYRKSSCGTSRLLFVDVKVGKGGMYLPFLVDTGSTVTIIGTVFDSGFSFKKKVSVSSLGHTAYHQYGMCTLYVKGCEKPYRMGVVRMRLDKVSKGLVSSGFPNIGGILGTDFLHKHNIRLSIKPCLQ